MDKQHAQNAEKLALENEELRCQLQEAQEVIHAIRTGAVDALAVLGPEGPRIFTLEGADHSYRTLIEQMNEGAMLLGEDGMILYANACVANLLGRPLEELIGSSFAGVVSPLMQEQWQQLFASGWERPAKGELSLHTRDARIRPLLLSIKALVFNDAPALAIILTDLAAQREIQVNQARISAQDALIEHKNVLLARQQAERLVADRAAAEARRMLEGIPQIAWTANLKGENTYLNRQWFEYTGQPLSADPRSEILNHIHPDDLEQAMAGWNRSLRTGEPLDIQCRILSSAGQYRWMLGRALPSRDELGHIIQWIGTYTDIHEHKQALERIDQAQRQLQENNAQLLRANVDLDNFIYTASHDLKAPINNIEGLLQELLSELPPGIGQGEMVQPLLAMMQDSVDRFKRTIEHLTEVTKLQKEQEQASSEVNLTTLIHEVSQDLWPLIREVEGQLEIEVRACPTVSFAEKNLRSVVYNLLSNAFKYSAPGRPARVRIQCDEMGPYVRLMVQDNGLGLNLAGSHKLFTMFQRFHDHVEGSGIGLYMVKRILENAGGTIEVQSRLGEGSVFTALLPRVSR